MLLSDQESTLSITGSQSIRRSDNELERALGPLATRRATGASRLPNWRSLATVGRAASSEAPFDVWSISLTWRTGHGWQRPSAVRSSTHPCDRTSDAASSPRLKQRLGSGSSVDKLLA